MRRDDEEQFVTGNGDTNAAPPPPQRRRKMNAGRVLTLAFLLACVAGLSAVSHFNRRAAASSASSASNSPAALEPPPQQGMSGVDFSKFKHNSQRHASLACADCHRRDSNNSTRPTLPGHKSCTGCHLPQFVTQNIPMCAICHTDLNSQNPPVKGFPSLGSFNAKFDHAQHNRGAARPATGCVACHTPAARRAAAMTIPAGLGAHGQCYSCHTPGAQANGRDIASCGVCHSLTARYFRTSTNAQAFRASFSHATHGARQRLGCADCHNLRAGLPQSQQVTAPSVSQHFNTTRAQSCMTCHNGRRAFGDADFNDCKRCHKAQTFRMGV
ncbi:MAG TPA: cytochrome c3 family protein [Pyrinomonadaceae bacterium]|nr:cytochrome c3 family protein [Pyrinomonadaceae bacterium]